MKNANTFHLFGVLFLSNNSKILLCVSLEALLYPQCCTTVSWLLLPCLCILSISWLATAATASWSATASVTPAFLLICHSSTHAPDFLLPTPWSDTGSHQLHAQWVLTAPLVTFDIDQQCTIVKIVRSLCFCDFPSLFLSCPSLCSSFKVGCSLGLTVPPTILILPAFPKDFIHFHCFNIQLSMLLLLLLSHFSRVRLSVTP